MLQNKDIIEEGFKLGVSIKDAIKAMDIGNNPIQLSEEEFLGILNILKVNVKNQDVFIRKNFRGYKKTIEKYRTIKEWEESDITKKLMVKKGIYTNYLYYHIMILCGRYKLDWNTLNSTQIMPEVFTEQEKNNIFKAAKELHFSEGSQKSTVENLKKIVLFHRKNLNEITEEDINEYRRVRKRNGYTKAMFYTLKHLGVFDSKAYYNTAMDRENYLKRELKCIHEEIIKIYNEFKTYTELSSYYKTAENRERSARDFLSWLYDECAEVYSVKLIEREHIKDYFFWIKTFKIGDKETPYSDTTINGRLSHLKNGFFKYLKKVKLLKSETESFIFGSTEKYSDLYFSNVNILPEPISLKDRLAIEKAIYTETDKKNELYYYMIILLYQLGMRPSELLCLKLNCVTGTEELPQLHIHRGKFFKERYIPLTSECLDIIRKLQEYNSKSSDLYMDFDGQTCQRLFSVRGTVTNIQTLEDYFSNLLQEARLVDFEDKPRYTLYVLRRLRITIWLERGIPEDIVAKLVGHDNVDSHNFYIVSKEARLENAKKAYEKFYEEFYRRVKVNEYYEDKIEAAIEEDFLESLKKSLLQIENKNINKVALEAILDEFPEYGLPVPCGVCMAKAFDNDFECEMMKLPCLECMHLLDKDIEIDKFDNFVSRVFKNRNVQIRKNLEGLVERSDNMIDRLKQFYCVKFRMTQNDVEERFISIENSSIIKRGRKRKIKIK
jgi:integrase